MSRYPRLGAATTMAGLVVAGVLAVVARPAAAEQPSKPDRCCFANWRYAGGCTVPIQEDQVCADILAVLNNPMSNATGYCGQTDVRGGWVEVSCEHPPGGVSTGVPARLPAQQPSLAEPPTMMERGVGTAEKLGAGPSAAQPTFITPIEPQSVKAKQPSGIVLKGGFRGW